VLHPTTEAIMKLFHRNATALLFEKIHSIRHFHDSWRCIHLTLSDRMQIHNRSLRNNFIINGIDTLLAEEEGFVYLCRDRDIFILFQGRAKPILTKLSSYFADMSEADMSDHIFKLYDLSKDWQAFFSVCYQKSLNEEGWKLPPKLTSNYPSLETVQH
jgi:hypothetical protein